jgi:hypothetical protein
MKKMKIALRVTVMAVAAVLLATSCQSNPGGRVQTAAPEFTGDKTKTTLDNGGFENWLNDWMVLSGEAFSPGCVVDSVSTFWENREFMAMGERFLNGYESSEKAVGKMCSSLFTLAGDGYISFLVGGAKTGKCYISIHTEDGKEIARYSNARAFKDPEMVLNLHREYMDLSPHIGKVLYIQLNDEDNRPGDFAAMTADDFIVSMTSDDVKALMKSTYEEIMALEDIAINRFIKNFYTYYKYPFPLEQ